MGLYDLFVLEFGMAFMPVLTTMWTGPDNVKSVREHAAMVESYIGSARRFREGQILSGTHQPDGDSVDDIDNECCFLSHRWTTLQQMLCVSR